MTTSPPPPGTPAGAPPSGGARFFGWLRSLQLTREPGWLGGVAAGIALRLRIDPLIVRGILVVLAIFAFPVALLYAVAWAFLPDVTGKIHAEEVSRGRVESGFVGAAILFVLALLGLGDGGPWFWGWGAPGWGDGGDWVGYGWGGGWVAALLGLIWTAAILGSIVWLIVWLVRRSKSSQGAQGGAAGAPQGATTATFVAPASAASAGTPSTSATTPTTATAAADAPTDDVLSADTTATTPLDGDLAAWQAQQAADRAQRDAFAAEQEARRQAEAARLAAERAARAAEYERHRSLRRRQRPSPLYTLAAAGLALLAGATTTLVLGGDDIQRPDVTIGLAVALAVLGAAIVINGVRGKRAGGSTGWAVVTLIALVIAGATPGAGSELRFVGSGAYTPLFTDDDEQVFVVGAGSTLVDLSDYWEGTDRGENLDGTVTVVSGAGDITVALPDEGSVEWEIVAGAGSTALVTDDSPTGDVERRIPRDGGYSESGETERMLTLEVISGAGDILFTTETPEGLDR